MTNSWEGWRTWNDDDYLDATPEVSANTAQDVKTERNGQAVVALTETTE